MDFVLADEAPRLEVAARFFLQKRREEMMRRGQKNPNAHARLAPCGDAVR